MIVTLRRACSTSPNALEILTDFIYYAYKFYTELLEEHNLHTFRGKWLEALGDLASYRMAVAIHEQSRAAAAAAAAAGGDPLTASKLACATARSPAAPQDMSRVGESPAPSVGVRAAAEMGESDERETWRATARDWYAMGLKDTPGAGRLQHHLGTLSRDIKGEELSTVYHFVKRSVLSIFLFWVRFLTLKQVSSQYIPLMPVVRPCSLSSPLKPTRHSPHLRHPPHLFFYTFRANFSHELTWTKCSPTSHGSLSGSNSTSLQAKRASGS